MEVIEELKYNVVSYILVAVHHIRQCESGMDWKVLVLLYLKFKTIDSCLDKIFPVIVVCIAFILDSSRLIKFS